MPDRDTLLARRDSNAQRARATKHGMRSQYPREYSSLKHAQYRCTNQSLRGWKNYGGRGIEFRFPDIGTAVRWAIANIGPRPSGASLDRIDNDGHYEPGNLRWALRSEQRRNQIGYIKSQARITCILELSTAGRTGASIARELGVTREYVNDVRAGRRRAFMRRPNRNGGPNVKG